MNNWLDKFDKRGLVSFVPIVEDAGEMSKDNVWVPNWKVIAEQARKLNAKTIKTKSGVTINFDSNWNVKSVNEAPMFDEGGETPLTDPKNKPTVYLSNDRSNYDPIANNIYFNPNNNPQSPEELLKHEGYHWGQNLFGEFQYPEVYPGPLRRPQTPIDENNPLIPAYFNAVPIQAGDAMNYMLKGRNAEGTPKLKGRFSGHDYNDVIINSSPSLQFVPRDVIWNGVNTTRDGKPVYIPGADALQYSLPETIEGDAQSFEYYAPDFKKPIMGIYDLQDTMQHKQGGLIKRADGHYSRRGLWDNIRANRGSGRKPTAAMLKQERKIKKHDDGGWINMYAEGDTVTNPPSELESLITQYQTIQDQVNKGNVNKSAYVENMRKIADDLIARKFDVNTLYPEYARNGNNCIGTACNLADQAGDKFYPEGSRFFIDNALAANYARDNSKASRYLEQDEKFLEPGDIIQFKRGDEKSGPYHAFTVYNIGEPNEDGDRVVTVVGTHGSGPMVKEDAYILGKDNKLYTNLYGSRGNTPYATQLLKRREGNDNSYNELVTQRDALKQQILKIDPQYFTPKEDIRSGDYKQTAFELNDQGQGNEYGKYVHTKDSGTDRYGNKLVPTVNIQTLNPDTIDQAYNARSYIDATNSGLTSMLTKYSDPQYKYDYMRNHNISSNEYDAIVKNMVGIYGAETKFGTDYTAKGKWPEWPWLSKAANTLGIIDQEEKSIGPFQLTYNQLPEAYKKNIKGHDLYNPMVAADATMEYLTAGLPLLRKRANTTTETATEDNPYSSNITKDNYLEYIPYLYNMRKWLKGDEYTQENYGDVLKGDAGYKQLVDQYANNVLQIIPTNLTTPQPLEVTPQQKNGGFVQAFKNGGCCNGMYGNGSKVTTNKPPQKSLKQALLDYKEGADENKWELIDLSSITSWDDAARGYDSWQKSGRTLPTLNEGMDMFSAIPVLGRVKKLEMGMKELANAPKWALDWWKVYNSVDYVRDEYNDKIKKKDNGSWVTNSSIPTPTTPSFYEAYPDRTLTNYQIGTDKAPMYGGGGGINPIYVTDPNDPRLKAYSDSLSLYNNYMNLKNTIIKGGKFYPNFESSKPLNKTKTDKFNIPNPNNPLIYKQVLPDFGYNIIGKTGLPDITIIQKKSIQPISTETFTRKESKYKSEAEFDKAAKQIKDFNEKQGQANWIGHEVQKYKEPVQPVKLKTEEIEPITRKFDFGDDELKDVQPIAPTPYVPNPVRRVMNPNFQESDYTDKHNSIVDPLGNPKYKYYNQDKVISESEYNRLMQKKANGGPVMYNAGSTVWTNQDTPLYAAGTPTPTATQTFRNDRSLNTDLYRIGDVIPTGMNYKTPAAGTHDYNQDVQPYHTMRLHAPDTTMMAKHGSFVKKHINSPRVYGSPINPSGMYQGPTSQRGEMMFEDGSTVRENNNYEQAKARYIVASNRGIMGEKEMQDLTKQFPQLANDASLSGYRSVGNAAMYRNKEEANRIVTNTLGQTISTPVSRLKAHREEVVARRPEVYNVQDYKMGIQEPGAPNDITDDPVAMAIIGTATGGVGLGAEGFTGAASRFAGNLASEATFGATDLGSLGIRTVPELKAAINANKESRVLSNLYKPIETPSVGKSFKSEIDWGKWNPETPNYPELINEYNAIEESTKKAGTWMKNPDGSAFQGTPEQFVQQQSSWFKKAFGDSKLLNPDGSPIFLYHGSAKKFDTFDPSKFQLGDAGYSGTGIYTIPSKTTADSYALSSAKFHSGDIEPTVYQLYGQGNRPIKASQLIAENQGRDLFNFHRDKNWKGGLSSYESLRDYDVAISDQLPNVENIRPIHDAREIVFPTNKQLKSAVGNVGFFDMTNPNIYKGLVPVGLGYLGYEGLQGAATQQKKQGGYVQNNNSNSWLDNYN